MSKMVTAIKGRLENTPRALAFARGIYRVNLAVYREISALLRVAPRIYIRRLRGANKTWQDALPVQTARRIPFRWSERTFSPDLLRKWCEKRGLAAFSGHDAVYLPPNSWRQSELAFLEVQYPSGCGLKIARDPGTSDQPYLRPRRGRSIQRWLSFSHQKQLLTFNFLFLKGASPRLFDLVELVAPDGQIWTAYVVQHIEGNAPTKEIYQRVVGLLKELVAEEFVSLVNPEAWNVNDFREPDCAGNLLVSQDGRGYYVDIHNFVLHRYDKFLREMGKAVASTSHFGGRSLILGGTQGTFLYQEIPGVDLPAKRMPLDRMKTIDRLAADCDFDFSDKVVFDIGCNLGLMGAEYLRRGAAWIHGWDMPDVIPATEQVLLSIGCTRFSLTPRKLEKNARLANDLPAHLRDVAQDRGVINYLAVRGHVGWLDALAKLPWRYMVYEGHQDDGDLENYVSELCKRVPVQVVAADKVSDAHSRPRDVAILSRR